MASVTEAGILRLYATEPNGRKHLVWQGRNGGVVSAGGSPDGVLANKTADKWIFLPRIESPVLYGGWKVQLTLEMDASDGLDASDAFISIPISVKGAGVRELTASDLGYSTDIPASTPAGIEVPIGAGYTIPNGEAVKIGGGPMAISIEDDTA